MNKRLQYQGMRSLEKYLAELQGQLIDCMLNGVSIDEQDAIIFDIDEIRASLITAYKDYLID